MPWLPTWPWVGPGKPRFLVAAPDFSHRSAGIRALYRLCHHLNMAGHRARMIHVHPGRRTATLPPWSVAVHDGPVGDAVVIYPEIVSGNPYNADRVVRWVLNEPGLLGGSTSYADEEVVFVYDPQKLAVTNKALRHPIGSERVLWVGVVDPAIIYPDPSVPRTMDCVYVGKGWPLKDRYPRPPAPNLLRLEDLTPTAESLGDTLRRTRVLYSYDHYSNLLREADLCGCRVQTIDQAGEWHAPQTCACPLNIVWKPDCHATYAAQFHDYRVILPFVRQLPAAWAIPA